MAVELRPLGVKCNIACRYCYQEPQREAGNVAHEYDIETMKEAVLKAGGGFTLFGGEPLLVKLEDLDHLWKWGLETFGRNGVQTNGTLITDAHIELFKKYQVQVGISIDGPGELNDVRWHGSLKRTRESTAKTEAAIEKLCQEGIPPSVIVTLHRGNATVDKLDEMKAWLLKLEAMGVKGARLHTLEIESTGVGADYVLTTEENVRALAEFARLEKHLSSLRFDVFQDMRNLLRGQDQSVTCVWAACDPMTTRAVQGVEGHGQRSNCGRTNKDGIDFVKADSEGFERYVALYHTPQEHGGCKGCRFFLQCKGQCPGTAIDGDWRNRTRDCELWKILFEELETDCLNNDRVPLSISPKREEIEQLIVESWSRGSNMYMYEALRHLGATVRPPSATTEEFNESHGDWHGDSG